MYTATVLCGMMSDSQQLPAVFLKTTLTSILREQGYDPETSRYEVLGEVEGSHGGNSSVYRVIVYPERTDSTHTLNLFFKYLDGWTRSETSRYFKNEANFYTRLLPALLTFQKQRNVPTPFAGVPTCYKCVSDGDNDVIVMEDLTERGYVTLKRLKGLDIAELSVMFQELGRFHALSLAMNDQDAVGFLRARTAIREELFGDLEGSVFGRFLKAAGDDALSLVKQKHPHDSLYVTKTQQFVDELFERMTMLTTHDPDEPHNVVSHGDLWINHFLFRYEDSGRVDAMCFIDFQACRYASLALDLSCALLLSTDAPTRVKHREAFLRVYHDALSELMTQLGSNPDDVIPYTALDGLVNRYAQFAVGMAMLNLPFQLNESENHDLLDHPEAEISIIVGKTDRCKQRVLEVIEEAVDNGYFDQLVVPCEGEFETTRL